MSALYRIWTQFWLDESTTPALLEGVGLMILALAVFDVSKYLIEEELLRDRELRSPGEARKTLTKFLTIVVIAVSLESIVFVFQAGKEDMAKLLYPALLLAVVGMLVAVLGHYQQASQKVERSEPKGGKKADT
jgi:hypothetical protein